MPKDMYTGRELTPLEIERNGKFQKLADAQRGKPERAMLACQHHILGAGVQTAVLEHCGDLTWRMADRFAWQHGQRGAVYDKCEKVHRWLTYAYGFEREMRDNMRNNYRARTERAWYNENQELETRPFEELEAEFLALWDKYAQAHAALTVYNEPQKMAREAAVALGNRQFDRCISLLESLMELCTRGEEAYIAATGAYLPGKTAAPPKPEDIANLSIQFRDDPHGFEVDVYSGGTIVGGMYIAQSFSGGTGAVEVRGSKLNEELRGKGIGRWMYDAAIAEAKRRGYTRFFADSDQTWEARQVWNGIAQRHPVEKDKWGNLYVPLKAEKTAGLLDNANFKAWFRDSKVVDANGQPLRVYRGDFRADRTGDTFKVNRTTSGRFYFTDDPEIASSYATNKPDYAHREENEMYHGWFKFPDFRMKRERLIPTLKELWYRLTPQQKARVQHVVETTMHNENQEIVLDAGKSIYPNTGLPELAQHYHGNWLMVAYYIWLESGALYDMEEEFSKILDHMQLPHQYDNPYQERSIVTPVYLSIQNPLDTSAIPQEMMDAFHDLAKRDRARAKDVGVDDWDKATMTVRQWVQRLDEDHQNGTTYAWTTLPEKITKLLQSMGYDGIKDKGGKSGGMQHTVWIAFKPNQIKSALTNSGKYDPNKPRITAAAKGWIGPVYHGSKESFDTFEPRSGTRVIGFGEFTVQAGGFFFTDDPEEAKKYGPIVRAFYLHMRKPLVRQEEQYALTQRQIKDLTYICEPLMSDSYSDLHGNAQKVIELGAFAIDVDEGGDWLNEVVKENGIDWCVLDNPQAVARMKERGYDSTMVHEGDGRYSYFVLSNDQIRPVGQKPPTKTAYNKLTDEDYPEESNGYAIQGETPDYLPIKLGEEKVQRTDMEDYVDAYLRQYRKGVPGIAQGIERPDGSGELVYRNPQGVVVGVVAYSPEAITDIAVRKDYRRQGVANALAEALAQRNIDDVQGPYTEEGLAFANSRKQAGVSKHVSGEEVASYVQKLNNWDRQKAYEVMGLDAEGEYELRDFPLSKLKAGDEYVPSVVERYAKLDTPFPPVVLGISSRAQRDLPVMMRFYAIRDGNHRVAAAKLRGDKTILAYVPLDTQKGPFDKTKSAAADPFPPFEQWVAREGGLNRILRNFDAHDFFTSLMPTDATNEEALLEVAQKYLSERYEEFASFYAGMEFPLSVYREVTLGSIEELKTRGIGIYWAWDIRAAEAHWGSSGDGQYFLLKAIVRSPSDVDWNGTMWANLDPSLGDEEKEIRVKSGAKLKFVGYHEGSDPWYGADREWRPLQQKVVTASKTAFETVEIQKQHGNALGLLLESDKELRAWAKDRVNMWQDFCKLFKNKRMAILSDIHAFKQGKGIGTKIYREFEARATRAQMDGIIIEVGTYEKQLKGFDLMAWYNSLGFESTLFNSGDLPLLVKWLRKGKTAAWYDVSTAPLFTEDTASDRVRQFIEEAKQLWQYDPKNGYFYLPSGAHFKLSPGLWSTETLRLDMISSPSKGKGEGSAALRELLQLADQHQLDIEAYVLPSKWDKGLDRDQLKAWYGRHGFELQVKNPQTREAHNEMLRTKQAI